MGYIIVLFLGLVLFALMLLSFSKSGKKGQGGTLPKDDSGSGGTS